MNAIILAGGHSTRMIASNQFIHKPLLPIQGLPNIERTVLMLIDFGITDITIVAGVYANQYVYLQKKYKCTIISDPNTSVSTLYGIYSILEKIGDTFIIEGDVVFAENIFRYQPYSYYYLIKYENCEKDAWLPITNTNGRIVSFKIGRFSEPCIFGVSFWSKNNADYIKEFLKCVCSPENLENTNKFWDDYFVDILDYLPIFTHEISSNSATEMNNAFEYNQAIKLCEYYYSNPNAYFLNLQDKDKKLSFHIDKNIFICYTKKLLADYNYKHPNDIQDLNINIKFSNNEYMYIIQKDEINIGFIDIVPEKRFLILKRIYLDELYRNQSLGTIILKKIITFAKLINKELKVNVYDEHAARFYKRLGFKYNFTNYILRGD